MPAITPDSDVIICKSVPLDIGYEHTIYQSSAANQYTMFYGYKKYELTAQSYQRLNRNYIRVGLSADNLLDCNYLMFRNTSYLNKWFYAFITEVNYINDNTAEIRYEIDAMQSYYIDYDLGRCFVEREHSLTDALFESLVDEGLDPGDMIVRYQTDLFYDPVNVNNPEYHAIIYYIPNKQYLQPRVYTNDADLTPADLGQLSKYSCYNFIPSPTMTLAIRIEAGSDSVADFTLTSFRYAIDVLTSISATIISIQMIPTAIAQAYGLLTGTNNDNTCKQYGYSDTMLITPGTSFADIHDNVAYTPKNKKLYQYPYTFLTLSNNNGDSMDYKWELFDHSFNVLPAVSFQVTGVVSPDVVVHCYPYNYREGGATGSRDLGLTVADFPRLSWSVDSFQEWWNVNKNTFALSMISKVIGTAASGAAAAATGNPLLGSAAVSGVGAIAQSLAQLAGQKAAPDAQRGNTSGSAIQLRERRTGFTLFDMTITGERAKIIDDYFTMYGYAVKALKPVNVRTAAAALLRPHWNYIKTSNVVVHGNNMNAEAERQIEGIYNKGITFWMNPAEVGNYALDNSPPPIT